MNERGIDIQKIVIWTSYDKKLKLFMIKHIIFKKIEEEISIWYSSEFKIETQNNNNSF